MYLEDTDLVTKRSHSIYTSVASAAVARSHISAAEAVSDPSERTAACMVEQLNSRTPSSSYAKIAFKSPSRTGIPTRKETLSSNCGRTDSEEHLRKFSVNQVKSSSDPHQNVSTSETSSLPVADDVRLARQASEIVG